MRMRRGFGVVVVAGITACAEGDGRPGLVAGGNGKADFYGTDDRQQIRDSQHPNAIAWARATAIVVNTSVLAIAGDVVTATVPSLGERQRLCAGERFEHEPVLGFCSSFLVAPDLVATAGHCFKQTLCEEMAYIFDYYAGGESEDVHAIPARNVYRCVEVVAQQWGNGLDYALVRLDRPTTGRTPFALQAEPPPVGARVALLGYPSGILAKIDTSGRVLRHEGTTGSRIRTSLDSFPGHSGGVAIDLATGAAFGVHAEGSSPSYVSGGACMQTAACATVTLDTGGYCDGAVETSVDVFRGCCDGVTPPPPPPPDPTPLDTCLPSGAPCDVDSDCANAMCVCETTNITTESFVVPGACAASGCVDQQAICERACADFELDDREFTLAWWTATCQAE